MTYGAGGSTRQRTHEVVTWVRRETAITPMAHLTCAGHRRRRDRPDPRRPTGRRGSTTSSPSAATSPPTRPSAARATTGYAAELVEDVRAAGPFSIGVAAHPEGHPRSPEPGRGPPPAGRQAGPGRLRHHPVLLRARPLPAPRGRGGGARRDQADPARDHAGHQQGPGGAHGRAVGRGVPGLAGRAAGRRRGAGGGPPRRRGGRPPSCARSCSTPALLACTSTRSTARRRPARSTPTWDFPSLR